MSEYLPFGKRIVPTQEQIQAQELKFQQYNYYGIPYGYFDSVTESDIFVSQKERDRKTARLLILEKKTIPPDLAKRLLEYKKQDETDKI